MLTIEIVIKVDRPAGQAIGIKEQVAMELEKFGDVRVVKIEERRDEVKQLRLDMR